jgi:peptidoglycan/LPS O-acetylase OafA/YrhL
MRILGIIAAISVSLLSAYILYILIEKPAVNWARRIRYQPIKSIEQVTITRNQLIK